ncbi:3-hydroxyacyl-ACP dehydratase FabZ [Anaerofustis sp.]|uniref:3-hydroxyacyl-ACP dehydratase FabZ n=1 Tax=Anaerofustis sp. TaxID=1872517 RepID=UPI0025C2129E|nr:3-hydroxyacyl-ACP dehydratase FabZ [Anaerofustis sp.]
MIYNSNDIQKIIPHRYPFLLVDTIEEIIDDSVIIGKKCISANEMQFMGHFPEKHVMPGVLMIEALAQTGAVLLLSKEENKGKIAVLAGVNEMRFKRQVIPGDVLTLKVELTKMKAGIGFANATAMVGEEIAVKGEIMFAVDK